MDLSTRTGVRSRPSRLGSSPRRLINSSISGANDSPSGGGFIILTTALFDFIGSDFKDVSRRLADADFLQFRPFAGKHFFPISLQSSADLETEILRGGDHMRECLDFRIEV